MAKTTKTYNLISTNLLPFFANTLWETKEYVNKTYSKSTESIENQDEVYIATTETREDGVAKVVSKTPVRVDKGEIKFGRTIKITE